jgi:dTDP-4-amino-4,6-dideoxygalactose transaminase
VFHYVPLHSAPAGRKFGRTAGPMAVTDDVSARLLRLPLYYELTAEQVRAITAEIVAFLG